MPKAVVQDSTPLTASAAAAAAAAVARDVPAHVEQPQPMVAQYTYQSNPGMAYLMGGLGTKDQIQGELDGIAAAMRSFHLKQPDQVLRECGAYSARLTELSVLLHRAEGSADGRSYQRVRTMQVQRFIEELDRQFKIASRLIEVARQDIALAGGMT